MRCFYIVLMVIPRLSSFLMKPLTIKRRYRTDFLRFANNIAETMSCSSTQKKSEVTNAIFCSLSFLKIKLLLFYTLHIPS
mmetsp:Transcript_25669/g.51081  ORF Transcript_25669/g.51081 Transcript_25669/m.51081 type:complete len:80 (+) Transcript_25669:1911-2150(+)